MIWRLRGELVFNTRTRRNTFASSYVTFGSGRTKIIDRSHSIDEELHEDGTSEPLPPTFRVDVAYQPESDTELLFNNIRIGNVAGLVRALLALHQCRCGDGSSLPPPPFHTRTDYWSFP